MIAPWRIDVLAAGQVLVEAGGDLDERAGAAADFTASQRRRQNPVEQLEDGGLAGAVRADDRQRLAGRDAERDVADGPELRLPQVGRGAAPADERRSRSRSVS
jgi:hypothetical protein